MAEIYDLDARYAEVVKEPFQFRWAGKEWELPHFGDIDWRAAGLATQIEAVVGDDGNAEIDVSVLQQLFDYAFGPEQAARWAKVRQPVTAMTMLFTDWQKHGGTSVGESSASTDSSASTVRPSKRTSRATTTGSGSRKPSSALPKSG